MYRYKLPISVVIITLNEEQYIGKLLSSIFEQEFLPKEVIVADSPKTIDRTREIASRFGCTIVDGGLPAEGLNSGASASKSEFIFFLAADTELTNKFFLVTLFSLFMYKNLDVACCTADLFKDSANEYSVDVINSLYKVLKEVAKFNSKFNLKMGNGLLVRREVYNNLNGFNESLKFGEDVDFIKRAEANNYKFDVIPLDICMSGRRFKTPAKAINSILAAVGLNVSYTLGLSGDKINSKLAKLYGKLGGGKDEKGV